MPFLPPITEYHEYLEGIWNRNWLTNNGPLVNRLELNLKSYLNLKHLLYVTNGTIALQIAIKALDLKGEIITTPFSFVATTSSIVWEGCTPIFVDIDPNSLNIDPTKIESAITKDTSAILATHVYGNPCDVEAIQKIATRHNLKVIYDGAHAFGVKYNGKSIFEYGDISTCSLHATKLYHSIEGGFVVTKNAELLKKMAYMRNFGFNGTEDFAELGINGKNSEFHAAMGLLNLKYIDQILSHRETLSLHYDQALNKLNATKQEWNAKSTKNYAYYPIIFERADLMSKCLTNLNDANIYPRRYFYPSLSSVLPYTKHVKMVSSDDISTRVLCLPLYHDLSKEEIELICRRILRVQNN